jgi:hypothetical protein
MSATMQPAISIRTNPGSPIATQTRRIARCVHEMGKAE